MKTLKMGMARNKALLSAAAVAIFNFGTAEASPNPPTRIEVVLSKAERVVDIALNPKTVVCSVRGYGISFLKVLVPELADITLLDHRNVDEAAPCIAAGACGLDEKVPEDLVDPARPTERVKIEVTHTKTLDLDELAPPVPGETDSRCKVQLHENIKAQIRGRTFVHHRLVDVGTRRIEDCR